jgi:hypothetical protein
VTKVLVVYYSDPPDPNWDHIIQLANPGMSVIVNPSSGPGSAASAKWSLIVKALQAKGAEVLGYVWTNYGNMAGLGAKNQCSEYATWYGCDGVFFDGSADAPSYGPLVLFAHGLGLKVVGNPGTAMLNTHGFDDLITFESTGYPMDLSQSFIAEGVTSFIAGTGAYMYATENDYMHLAGYFDSMVARYASGTPQNKPVILGKGQYEVL